MVRTQAEDTGVVFDNVLQTFFLGINACSGGIKDKKVVILGINIRYMIIIFLWVKIRDVFEGAHGKLYGI